MAPRGNLLLPSPAAFRSRDRGPQLTISGCVFLAGRAKRWEAQVRFASPISAVLGITDAARPRGEGSGARDSVPAADLVSGSEVNRSWSAAEDGRLCRTDLTLGVQSPWGGAGAIRMAVQTWRGDTASGPGHEGQRGSAGEARWAAPRQRPGPRPAPRRPPRFAFAPRPLGDAQAAQGGGGPGPSTGSRPSAGPGRSADPRV